MRVGPSVHPRKLNENGIELLENSSKTKLDATIFAGWRHTPGSIWIGRRKLISETSQIHLQMHLCTKELVTLVLISCSNFHAQKFGWVYFIMISNKASVIIEFKQTIG